MTVRLRDEVVVLEPATSTDPYTEDPLVDWDLEPASATPARFKGEPLSSTEEVLTADTIITRHLGYLEATWDGILTSAFRLRWDGEDYEIDGDVERHKRGSRVRYLTVLLKRVSSSGG